MNNIKKFSEFVNESLNEAVSKIKVYDDSAGPDEDGFKLLNKLKPNDKIQFIAGDIDPDDLDIETGVMKAKDAKKLFNSQFNESLNEANLPSWVEGGPYESLEDNLEQVLDDDMTIADINKNYKPALKYLGVKSVDNMGMVSTTNDDDELYDVIRPQMKSSNFLGGDKGKGMNTAPIYTSAYKGMLGDVKVVIFQDIGGENGYAYAAVDSRGNLK